MSNITTDQIEAIIVKYADYLNGHKTMAKEIHSLFHPTYKPLSELHLDEEACRLLFNKITQGKFSKCSMWLGWTRIKGFRTREDGQEWQTEVSIVNKEIYLDGSNVTDFDLVDFIRSLGYSA